jgi:circadian clock protein KaiC
MREAENTAATDICSTGISGLDEILNGGFPADRVYLVQGDPGSGKTTLALQFLREGVRLGQKCVYIGLSETKTELIAAAESHGWSLDDIELVELSALKDILDLETMNTVFYPSEVELNRTMKILLAEVEKTHPARVVFDSLSEIRLLAQEPLRYRRQILFLKQYFAGRKTTVLLLDDKTATDHELQVQSIAHGVLAMHKMETEFGAERRRLRIVKIRGHHFRDGNHDYVIATGGLAVFPRLVAADYHREFRPDTVSSGVAELDALLGGGLVRGTGNLILGPAGAGKSAIATLYARAVAGRGEACSIFLFEENREQYITRAASLGMDMRPEIERGRIRIQQIDPAEVSPGELAHIIVQSVEKEGIKMVLIDSLNGYLNAMPQERFLILQLHELLTYLNQQGVLTVVAMAQHGLLGDMQTPADVTYLADTVVILRYFEAMGEVRKAISVIKKRGGPHEKTIRELELGRHGIRLGNPLREFRGVLKGVPSFAGESADVFAAQIKEL